MRVDAVYFPAVGLAQTAKVRFTTTDMDIFGGASISSDYRIKYRSTDFAGMTSGERITIEGIEYKIRETRIVSSGLEVMATLSKVS